MRPSRAGNLGRAKWIVIVALVVAGAYFLVFHKDVPLSHEDVGLGEMHLLHDVIGIVLLVVAAFVWWRARRGVTSKASGT